MILNGSTNYDDRGGSNGNSNNPSVPRTTVNERSQLFRSYTSVYASRRRTNARAVHFTFYLFCAFEVILLAKQLFPQLVCSCKQAISSLL